MKAPICRYGYPFFITVFPLTIIAFFATFTIPSNDIAFATNSTKTNFDPVSPSFFGQGELYVGNAKSNTVSVIDLDNNRIIKNISVGESPHDIKISDDQQRVFTTDTDSSTISVVNATNNTLIKQIPTKGVRALHGIAISENENNNLSNNTRKGIGDNANPILYVGDVYGNRVLVVNGTNITGKINVGAGPEYLEISPNKQFLYVANLWSPISVVDLQEENPSVIKSIDSGETPHGLSFNANGSRLYIVNMYSNSLSIIDSNRHEVIHNIKVGNKPEYVKLSPDERFAYVTNLGANTTSKIDLGTLEVTREIPVGEGPHGIAFSADGDFIYISNMHSNDISVIDSKTDKVVSTIPTGLEPHQIVMKKPSISFDSGNKSTTPPIFVEIADDSNEQSKGLMHRTNLEWNNGMLFVFDDEENLSFWMKNTLIPLDMIFIDDKFRVVDIKENVQPCVVQNCQSYVSSQPAKYVLEVNSGYTQTNGIEVGDILKINTKSL